MKKSISLVLFFLIACMIHAEDSKIDTLLDISKKTGKQVNELYEQYRNDPLAGKTWGAEFNLVRLIGQTDKSSTFSGGFSYFGKPMMEVYFPYYYYSHKFSLEGNGGEKHRGYDQMFYADARIRMFTGNTSNGFFMSGLVRYASVYNTYYLKGIDDYWIFDDNQYFSGMENHRENKLGVGFGIGWRSFSYKGFYWAFSMSVGRYFVGDKNILHDGHPTSMLFIEEVTNDGDMFYDLEFLKFGYAF